LQDPPNFTQIGIFGSKTNHLASLPSLTLQQPKWRTNGGVSNRRKYLIGIFKFRSNCRSALASVTRLLTEKCAQFWPNIAQNGASVNKNFCPKKYLVKIRKFEVKK
jgi:hypothetical protein